MALRYPSHKISSAERYVAESTTAATGGTIALTDRVLVRLAFSGNGTLDLEAGTEDGLYRILLAESVTGSTRLENSTNVQLTNRAWLPQNAGEALAVMWNANIGTAPVGRWVELWRTENYDSTIGVYGKNNTGSTLTAGTVVYIGSAIGSNPIFARADYTTEATSAGTVGLIHKDIPANEFGYALTYGTITGIKVERSAGVAASAGDVVYLGASGAFIVSYISLGVPINKPVAPNHIVKLGHVLTGSTGSSGVIQVNISNGWELDELHNVLITSPTNGQVLTYDSATSLWKNAASGGGGGGTPSIGGTITGGTAGSILFVDPAATIAEDNTNLYWDNTNNELAITPQTAGAPSAKLEVNYRGTTSITDYVAEFKNSSTTNDAGRLLISQGSTVGLALQTKGTAGASYTAPFQWVTRSTGTTVNTPMTINASSVSIPSLDVINAYVNGGGNLRIRPTSSIADGNIMFENVTFPGTMDAFLYTDGTNSLTVADTNGVSQLTVTQTNKVGIGPNNTAPDTTLHVLESSAGVVTPIAGTTLTTERNGANYLTILSTATQDGGVLFGSTLSAQNAGVVYNHSTGVIGLRTASNTTRLNASSTGVAIGLTNTAAATQLEIGGTNPYITMATELTSASPTNPTSNKMILIGQRIANRGMLAIKGNVGHETALQPYMGHNKVGVWSALAGAAVLPAAAGISFTTVTGATLTARIPATTNALTYMNRYGMVTVATAGTIGHQRTGTATTGAGICFTGSGATNRGGFAYTVRFGISDAATVAGARMFVGLINSTAVPTNVAPTSLLQCVGICQLDTDGTQLYIIYNGTNVTATTIALGAANFPINSTTPYELALYAPSDTVRTIYYEVTNLDTGAIATGTVSGAATTVPDSNILLSGHHWRTNNATALAVGLDISQVYFEMDQ